MNENKMERKNSNRTRKISLRLTPEEYAAIEQRMKASTCRKLSDYARQKLFDKPVTSYYRNQSLDDFMAEMSQLRKELNHIGNNFNQAVKRLHTLNQIPEFKNWLIAYELERKTFFNKVDEIKRQIQKIAETWLQ
jgi:GTP1/Obg family GTP-binding protein